MHALKIQPSSAPSPEHSDAKPEQPQSLLIGIEEFARLAGLSARTLRRLSHQGLVGPVVVELGRARRWRREEVVSWLNAGCPARDSWKWEE
jgi:predicted DNA-binding transcriptional regulator AlpA